jgi:hypothetical protein
MDLNFTVESKLYKAGVTEDGEEYIAETYFVQAEDVAGNRWAYPAFFPGCKVVEYDEGPGFEDVREAAKATASELVAAILQDDGVVDLAAWVDMPAAYGSRAYQEYGFAEEIARERLDS